MNQNNKDFEKEYDSLKDVAEFQNNMFNPGHYIGTGKVAPTISAPGNATPLAIACFFGAAFFCVFGLFLFFSDASILSYAPLATKIGLSSIMWGAGLLLLIFGFIYLKKARRYYKKKVVLKTEQTDETVKDELWQRTCPKCGKSHDIDYPKCPNCKFNYIE